MFLEFFKKPRKGEIYNVGGCRYSNCSVIEALKYIEEITGINIKKFEKQNRVGDHIWYVSSMKKFKKHYPKWSHNIFYKK